MPREFRKRGRGGNKQKDDEEYGEVPQAIQPIVATHDVMELAQETEEDGAVPRGSNEDTTKDPNLTDFPLLTPDLKAYWREIDEKLQELERLGLGPYHSNSNKPSQKNEEDDEDEEDERQLLLRSALAELGGHELALASDPETSIILERIIFSMDGFAKRVLVDRFIGRFVDLSNHPHGSHVLQTLLASCASVLDVEASQSNSNKNPKDEMDQDEDLPLMCELLSQVCEVCVALLPPYLILQPNIPILSEPPLLSRREIMTEKHRTFCLISNL
jgi:nucleolar protein 9